jgi:hypothetical protein
VKNPDRFAKAQIATALHKQTMGDVAGAIGHYRAVLSRHPRHAHALYFYALACQQLNRNDEAIRALHATLKLTPTHADAWYNLGRIYHATKRPELAIQHYIAALEHNPDHIEALTNVGNLYLEFGERKTAEVCYHRALAQDTARPEAQYNRAFIRLSDGDWERGWQDHEARWKCPSYVAEHARDFQSVLPRWNGEAIPGKTLLIHWEQGFGDTIQFSRFIPDAIRQSQANVVLEMQRPLARLMARSFPSTDVVMVGDDLPPFDAHISTASLPSVVPGFGRSCPYLTAIDRSTIPARKRVGLCWGGNTQQLNDYNRSAGFEMMRPIVDVPNVDFLSLQVGERAHECGDMPRVDPKDFADTADAIAGLDLVITVDTSVAHIAGAVGTPVWIMIPLSHDWRYPREGPTTPWYPTATLYRQTKRQEWAPVIDAMAHDLNARVNGSAV